MNDRITNLDLTVQNELRTILGRGGVGYGVTGGQLAAVLERQGWTRPKHTHTQLRWLLRQRGELWERLVEVLQRSDRNGRDRATDVLHEVRQALGVGEPTKYNLNQPVRSTEEGNP